MPLTIQNVYSYVLRNHQCTTQPTCVNLHPNDHTQGLRHYLFTVNLDRCVGSCNILKNLIKYVRVLN